jgi:hypothetical protein
LSQDSNRFLQLLEKRIDLMQSLANSLAIANSSLVTFDLDNLESAINRQEQLSLAIGSLNSEINQVQTKFKCALQEQARLGDSDAVASAGNSIQATLDRLAQIQATVRNLNDTHLILLQKSRRTVHALLNSYQSFVSLYSNPHSNLPADRALAAERI